MASVPGNSIGLTVPGRPSTPCNGRTQHYNRPGNPLKQVTRTFPNGTTLTFGPEDIVGTFSDGDPFYDQALAVETATTDLVAIRRQYQDGGYPVIPYNGGISHNVGQYGRGNVASSGLQQSFAALNISAAPPSMSGHRKASEIDNHLLAKDELRKFAKSSRRGRYHGQSSHEGFRIPNGNLHKHANELHLSGPNLQVSFDSYGVRETAQKASNMAAQGHNLPGIPTSQSGFHYNSFGVSIPGLVPQQTSRMTAQDPTLPATQTIQPCQQYNAQQAPIAAAYQPVHLGFQMPQLGFTFNPQTAGRNCAAQHTSSLTTYGSTLPAISVLQPGSNFYSHVAAQNLSAAGHTSLVPAEGRTLFAASLPDLNYYGPPIHMSASHQDFIMAANGIKLPAKYIPDPRYYHGPLRCLPITIAQAIMTAVESSQYPDFPFYRPRGNLAQVTMLTPFGLPPQCYISGTSQMDIHNAECNRHKELMREVLAVPGKPEHGEEPMRWYRILGEPRLRREQLAWHPNVIDLYGRESQYEHLLVRDVNHRNNNEKGVGRKNAPGNRQAQVGTTMRVNAVSQKPLSHTENTRDGQGSQTALAMMYTREESEDTSVFFRDNRTPPASQSNLQYVGYRMKVRRHEEPSPEISPTPPARVRSAGDLAGEIQFSFNRSKSETDGQRRTFSTTKTPLNAKRCYSDTRREKKESSASKTPLLDFDRQYTAKHGAGEDVNFATRDMGPPRFGGKTFNEKIGFTPSPEKGLGSKEPFSYPMNVVRRHRD